ncbi:peptide deformylase [Candidatus Magnetominusculus xianensis]|uniref:Peptide deformylase n=1 Tax=Candidatus Magnetominusculus xianensis TaxID=1748249 RepID=A0ABR5SBL6_9BACT|nr:peptide deformylase [Candidatus Magnetominusculus xianensis]KWT78171.1 peptide deformylase [Candidatus Magnetominusculus xianensis]MBF0404692.1 peptide deformylase [Nitrospirota bacterium]
MPLLKIKTYPAKVLKQTASPFKNIDGSTQRLIDDMIETMYDAAGIGLAAPQVGVSKRLIILDTSLKDDTKPSTLVIINPEIVYSEGDILSTEGCLSIPEFTTTVERRALVFVRGLDRDGKPVEIEAARLLCRALQHEIDHLNGILLLDKLSMEDAAIRKINST